MVPVIYGFLSFSSLVFSILTFSRSHYILGWIGASGFAIFMAATFFTL